MPADVRPVEPPDRTLECERIMKPDHGARPDETGIPAGQSLNGPFHEGGRRVSKARAGGISIFLNKVEKRRPKPVAHGRVCRAIRAETPPVTARNAAGASSMSNPRRPPETKTVSYPSAEVSSTVGSARFWPTGDIPPTT